MTKSYNSVSNRIETIYPTHIEWVQCYTFTFEEWRAENNDAITEYIWTNILVKGLQYE